MKLELTQKKLTADELLDQADRVERENEKKRCEMMKTVASKRWYLANHIHETEDGGKMDFDRWPFQRELYQTDAQDLVIIGATGWGKSLYSIVDDFAKAMCGLRVIHVCDKAQKRNAFVLGIVDPLIHRIPFYAALLRGAAEERKAEQDSSYSKHFGDGIIYYLSAQTESDFFSYRGDSTMVDEYQLCDQENVEKLFGRRTGSFFRFQTVMGNPKDFGTAQNRNIHWQYLLSDQRQWHIPCPRCHEFQRLGWTTHFVNERRNDYGALIDVRIRDEERAEDENMDPRPMCTFCEHPMWRLHPEGMWKVTNPGKRRVGYQLSNFHNPDVSVRELMGEYRKGIHNPNAMGSFVNNQCGDPYSVSGANITEQMLEQASTGIASGIDPYNFEMADMIEFEDMDIRT